MTEIGHEAYFWGAFAFLCFFGFQCEHSIYFTRVINLNFIPYILYNLYKNTLMLFFIIHAIFPVVLDERLAFLLGLHLKSCLPSNKDYFRKILVKPCASGFISLAFL